MNTLKSFDKTDIYLLDQILKERFSKESIILDAGCGSGRNMRWFAQNNYTLFGCDLNNDSIKKAQDYTQLSNKQFKNANLNDLPYDSRYFDVVICNAVLHFAVSEPEFLTQVKELYRVLKPNGILFIRMTSIFGLPKNYSFLGNGRYLLKDGTERFLLTSELLNTIINTIGFKKLEPVKSVLVEELRSMTTLVLTKV